MISAANLTIFLLSLAVTCHAYSTFTTTCTTPPPHSIVNFVSSPDSRGTLDILWSCLFTIIACTWTIQHLNLPEQRPPKAKQHGAWCDFKWALKGFWTNFKWMIFTMVAPEVILGKALGDLAAAWDCLKHVREYAEADGVEWGLAHGFYANMGGFLAIEEGTSEGDDGTKGVYATGDCVALVANDIYKLRSTLRANTPPGVKSPENQVAVVAEDSGGEAKEGPADGQQPAEKEPKAKLERLPDITFAELNDKSKGNIFIKIIAIIQVLWNILQIIVRVRRGLSVSQLELAVAAFSVCAVLTYIILIPKPQGVQVASRPVACERGSLKNVLRRYNMGKLRILFIPGYSYLPDSARKHIPNDSMYGSFEEEDNFMNSYAYFFGLMFAGMIFGGVHVAGWNLVFPTPIERELWRISSILLTTLMPALFLHTLISLHSKWADTVLDDHMSIFQTWNGVLCVLYIAARLFILVEIFRTLLFLPSDAYVSTFASNVPHVA